MKGARDAFEGVNVDLEGVEEAEEGERESVVCDLERREGGWANAGRDRRVERARGDWDML